MHRKLRSLFSSSSQRTVTPVSWESLHVHSCADSERCTTGCDLWRMRGLVLIKCASPQTRGMNQQSIAFCCSVFIQPPTPPCSQRYLPHQPHHKSSGKEGLTLCLSARNVNLNISMKLYCSWTTAHICMSEMYKPYTVSMETIAMPSMEGM